MCSEGKHIYKWVSITCQEGIVLETPLQLFVVCMLLNMDARLEILILFMKVYLFFYLHMNDAHYIHSF